ncbi:type II secretion system protein [Methylobacillus flagellatus]|nr:type II secretion system protein [Methylobacillus flagellatus]
MNIVCWKRKCAYGFSLVEMAVVLVILGFVITALILPVTAQRAAGFLRQTEHQLEIAQKALIGFAQANGRLPCPATAQTSEDAGSSGLEQSLNGGGCTVMVGYLPAATLGIAPVDMHGFAVDGWGNRIWYAVTQAPAGSVNFPFTTAGHMSLAGMGSLSPDLQVWTRNAQDNSVTPAISNAVAVVFSTGASFSLGAGGEDEFENLNVNSNKFFNYDQRASGGGGEFDHKLVWISPYVLYNAMIQAGQLP